MDPIDAATIFVAESVASLRGPRPALHRALRDLAADVHSGQRAGKAKASAEVLAQALGKKLDESRLSEHISKSGDEYLISIALSAAALIGCAACSRIGDLASATALLDNALLRTRNETHCILLRSIATLLDGAYSEAAASRKRPRCNHWPSEAILLKIGSATKFGTSVRTADPGTSVEAACEPLLFSELAADWPAISRWSDPSYLHRAAGSRTVPVEVGATHLGAEGGGVQEQTVLVTLSEFIDNVVLGGQAATASGGIPTAVMPSVPVTAAATRGYLAQHRLFEQCPQLAADIRHPQLVPSSADCRAWFGPAGVVTPIHHDLHHGVLVQVVGCKRLLLWPPGARGLLRAPPLDSPLANTSPLDPDGAIDSTSREDDVNALRSACSSVVLTPGDALFIPQGWWHHARSLSVSFSVSFWWDVKS